jgi:anti-anti-sigma factor
MAAPHSGPTTKVLRPRSDVAQVVLGGEHDLASAHDLATTIDIALHGCDHLIVDLSETEFIDSSTIHTIVKAKNDADAWGKRFNLVLGTTAIIEKALELSGLLPQLNRVHTVDGALSAS